MNQFHVGQQVVCIDDKVPIAGGGSVKDAKITEGQIYTVRWVGMAHHYVFGDYLGVKLEGIDSGFGKPWGQDDMAYAARRFRPLVRDKLAVLRSIAAGGPIVPSIEEPRRKAPAERVKEDVE